MKGVKSTIIKMVKKINSAFIKASKILHVKPKILYIILSLLAVLLVALGLGTIKEGLTSSAQTQLVGYNTLRTDTRNKIIQFANTSIRDNSQNFLNNLENYFSVYGQFKVQNYLRTKDVNADGIVVVNKSSNKYIRDNSGTVINTGEKPYYIDVNAKDLNHDGKVVAYRNTDSGNFYRDNSGTEVFPTSSPYILQSLDTSVTLKTQAMVDAALLPVTTQINAITNADDKKTINDLIKTYTDLLDNIIKIEQDNESSSQLYTYDPNSSLFSSDLSTTSSSSGGGTRQWNSDTGYSTTGTSSTTAGTSSTTAGTSSTSAGTTAAGTSSTTAAGATAGTTSSAGSASTGTEWWKNWGAGSVGGTSTRTGGVYGATGTYNSSLLSTQGQPGTQGQSGQQGTNNVPSGSEDLYMLKTQIIPPGCPVGGCGTAMSSSGNMSPAGVSPEAAGGKCKQNPIPPCPPCERCPEPAFDCKRVPNYNSSAISQYLPRAVLADFSQFGM